MRSPSLSVSEEDIESFLQIHPRYGRLFDNNLFVADTCSLTLIPKASASPLQVSNSDAICF